MTNDTSNTFTYDAEGEMTTAGGSTLQYDGDGLRVKSNSKLRWRMLGAGMYLTTTDASGGTVKDMIYFAGEQVAQRAVWSGAVSYYLNNQVGSVRMMVDAAGSTCWNTDYYPFGGWDVLGTLLCQPQYRYALMETEPTMSSDVDYAMYRHYSHRFARFMSPDPIGGDPGNPQSWNRYAYVMNNPSVLNDPTGLFPGLGAWYDAGVAIVSYLANYTTTVAGSPIGSVGSSGLGWLAYNSEQQWITTPRKLDGYAGADCKPGKGGCAANNSTNCTPLTPGCSNVPTAKQACLAGWNNSAIGKGVQFLSLFNFASNLGSLKTWAEWTALPYAKVQVLGAINKLSQTIGNTEFLSVTGGTSTVVTAPTAAGITATEAAGSVVAPLAILGATAMDMNMYSYCSGYGIPSPHR